MPKSYFITATGTGIGKTFLTAALCRSLLQQEMAVQALKPIITGWNENDNENDTGLLLAACGIQRPEERFADISPWRFNAPLSPHLASRKQGVPDLDIQAITSFCREKISLFPQGMTFIEGVGGVMAPLNAKETVLDWIQAVGVPVILVTGSYLGTFSHTLTALFTLHHAGVRVAGIIVNEVQESPYPFEELKSTLSTYYPKLPVFLCRYGGQGVEEIVHYLITL